MGITPSSTVTRPRQDLLGAYMEFDPASQGLIADLVAPTFEVAKRTGTFGVVPREAWLQRVNTKRAPKAATSESGWSPDSDSFELVEYAHKEFCDEVEGENFADWFDQEEVAAGRTAMMIAIDREVDVAAAYINETTFPASGNTGVTLAGGSEWDQAAATPITDVITGKLAIRSETGMDPNTLILPYRGFLKLSGVTQIKNQLTDNFGPIKPGIIPVDRLKAIFEVENIFVAKGVYNSAKPGQAPTIASIWDEDYAWLGRIDSGRDIKMPQAARTFQLAGKGPRLDSWQQNDPPGTYVRSRHDCVVKMMSAPVGYLIKNIKA
jgi:hypothetical protein